MEENRTNENGRLTDAEATDTVAEIELEETESQEETVTDEPREREEDAEPDVEERAEYERLIKTRFKGLYAADVQKMINRRFRKYKVLEERYKIMEESLAQKDAKLTENEKKIAEFDEFLKSELEKAVKETEERILNQVRARQMRPVENAVTARTSPTSFDVARLTKSERAKLAKRAANGERIKF